MGDGLRRVAKACGGLTATSGGGVTVRYDAEGNAMPATFRPGRKAKADPNDPLLVLDPSSTALGWAWFHRGELVSCGTVRATSADFGRRMAMLWDKLRPVLAMGPHDARIVIEWHYGREMAWVRKQKEGRSIKTTVTLCHGQGALYGMLCGEGRTVETITDREWTKGKGAKEKRAEKIRQAYPDFGRIWGEDKGLDATDAVGLGLWWLGRAREADIESRGKVLRTRKASVTP